MEAITFDESSRLKRIGEGAFHNCSLRSITIPASVEEMDGSAFVGCPLNEIRVARENQKFMVEGSLLFTADGTEIVRYFGRARVIIVSGRVEVLGKSCFESCSHIERIAFERGSTLRRIGSSALSGCEFLTNITIPASVEVIEESAFKKCDGLEECLIKENAHLMIIGKEAFGDCCSLRSFYVPQCVEGIGERCFSGCGPLRRLRFGSIASLKKIVGDGTVDAALENIGFGRISSLFRIEVDHGGVNLEFPGWISVADGGSTLALIQGDE
jgi:hypothetical protein